MQKKVIEVQEYQSGYKDRDGKLYLSMDDCAEDKELTLVKEFTPLPTVVKSQSFVVKYDTLSDGTLGVQRTVDGFSAIELLGVLEAIQHEIILQMNKKMPQPDIVKRTVIQD